MVRLWAEGEGATGVSQLVAYQEGVKYQAMCVTALWDASVLDPLNANVNGMRCESVLTASEAFGIESSYKCRSFLSLFQPFLMNTFPV